MFGQLSCSRSCHKPQISSHVVLRPLRYDNGLRPLESIARLQGLPALHTPGLDTDHVLVPVLGREIGHPLRFLDPGVPDNDVVQVIPHHAKHGLAPLLDLHRRRRPAGRGVHPVRLARELDLGGALRLFFLGVDFVDVAGAREARYGNRVDVLRLVSKTNSHNA